MVFVYAGKQFKICFASPCFALEPLDRIIQRLAATCKWARSLLWFMVVETRKTIAPHKRIAGKTFEIKALW